MSVLEICNLLKMMMDVIMGSIVITLVIYEIKRNKFISLAIVFVIRGIAMYISYATNWYENVIIESILLVMGFVSSAFFLHILCVGDWRDNVAYMFIVELSVMPVYLIIQVVNVMIFGSNTVTIELDDVTVLETANIVKFTINNIICYICVFLSYVLVRKVKDRNILPHKIAVIMAYAFGVYMFVTAFSGIASFIKTNAPDSGMALYIMFITIALFIVVVKLLLVDFKKKQLVNENNYLSKQNQIQYEYYEAFDEYQQELRKMKHDISNHLYTIELMLENSEESEGKRYAKEVSDRFKIKQVNFCDNRIVDAVLYSKISLAQSNGIRTSVNVILSKDAPFEQIDLMCIFSNLLDNAIEACINCDIEDKFIELNVRKIKGQLVIKCDNSCKGKVEINKDYMINTSKILNSKKDELSHGLGMKLIKSTAEKYNGSFYCEQNGGVFTEIIRLELERNY